MNLSLDPVDSSSELLFVDFNQDSSWVFLTNDRCYGMMFLYISCDFDNNVLMSLTYIARYDGCCS